MISMGLKQENEAIYREIERHLRNYNQYKIGIRNYQHQLELIMPSITPFYELREGSSGGFDVHSATEDVAIERVEGAKAENLRRERDRLQVIVDCIERAFEGLSEIEKQFIEMRYFNEFTARKTAICLKYSESNIYNLRNKVLDKLVKSLRGITTI